jgi:hypothetical protein
MALIVLGGITVNKIVSWTSVKTRFAPFATWSRAAERPLYLFLGAMSSSEHHLIGVNNVYHMPSLCGPSIGQLQLVVDGRYLDNPLTADSY